MNGASGALAFVGSGNPVAGEGVPRAVPASNDKPVPEAEAGSELGRAERDQTAAGALTRWRNQRPIWPVRGFTSRANPNNAAMASGEAM
ncbi:hypothetical protein F4827_001228 [Paraburkholderia bannensis]|uniref:Uncharacterized protein n=1 Tax=Paraburkholderia bannensis TaxID=765414 RepID=A0A7W9TUN3_9BURK|nr:hypothetical protein [Paraburkholderia bannensis]MBB3256395.1 hypothetical protein [Paraburkholderia sp. WP4_3_2]MBB6101394.1 hypothetical protein [Paraburkholderia bannensis]